MSKKRKSTKKPAGKELGEKDLERAAGGFSGGVRVAAADVNGDVMDPSAGTGAGPQIRKP